MSTLASIAQPPEAEASPPAPEFSKLSCGSSHCLLPKDAPNCALLLEKLPAFHNIAVGLSIEQTDATGQKIYQDVRGRLERLTDGGLVFTPAGQVPSDIDLNSPLIQISAISTLADGNPSAVHRPGESAPSRTAWLTVWDRHQRISDPWQDLASRHGTPLDFTFSYAEDPEDRAFWCDVKGIFLGYDLSNPGMINLQLLELSRGFEALLSSSVHRIHEVTGAACHARYEEGVDFVSDAKFEGAAEDRAAWVRSRFAPGTQLEIELIPRLAQSWEIPASSESRPPVLQGEFIEISHDDNHMPMIALSSEKGDLWFLYFDEIQTLQNRGYRQGGAPFASPDAIFSADQVKA